MAKLCSTGWWAAAAAVALVVYNMVGKKPANGKDGGGKEREPLQAWEDGKGF